MADNQNDIPKISTYNTKKEIFEAFNLLKKRFEEQAKAELKPEKVKKEREEKEIVKIADKVASESAINRINDLKIEIGNELSDISGKLETETKQYNTINNAMKIKEKELEELFEIEKSAFTLAALIEAQKLKKLEYENEMLNRKKELEDEIESTKIGWEKEQQQHAALIMEKKKEEEKIRKREKEEYEYSFNREKELKKSKVNDEIRELEKKIKDKKEEFQKQMVDKEDDLLQREIAVSEREKKVDDLQKRVDAFPAEMESQVNKMVKATTDALKAEVKKNEELIIKGYEGEKNVLMTKIESLDKVVTAQKRQIEILSGQIDSAYSKVQDIAVKAVSGAQHHNAPAANTKSVYVEKDKS